MNKFEAIILDFDGTLADLSVDWPELIANIKKLLPQSIADNYFPIDQKVEYYLGKLENNSQKKESSAKIKQRIENIRLESEKKAINSSIVYPDSFSLIDFLNENNIPTGILTANFTEIVRSVVEISGLNFSGTVIGRDKVKNQKPDLEGAKKLIEILNTPPSKIIIVGDSEHDILIGKNLGIKTCFIDRGKNRQTITRADKIITSLEELITDD